MAMRKKRKDTGRKRRPYKKRVVSINKKKEVGTAATPSDTATSNDKYGQRGMYKAGVYSDRSPQEDAYRKRQLGIDESRIRRQQTADRINMVREGRGWLNTASNIAAFL